jgi:hypothetical protein
VVISAFALIPLPRNTKRGDQFFGVFPMTFRALTLIHIRGRSNLLKLVFTVLTVELVECHALILQDPYLSASGQKFACDIAHSSVCML